MKKIIIGGASNTQGPWPTWADFVKLRYNHVFYDASKKGMGNEAIITTALKSAAKNANKNDDILLLLMLTSIDKWDWYVTDPIVFNKLNKEKHNITQLDKKDKKGFWSTGSHFPLDKSYFKEHYYSNDYFMYKTLTLIEFFKNVCQKQNWKYKIFFDSPIFSMTENELKQPCQVDIDSFKLINNTLCDWLFNVFKIDNTIYYPGLIGFLYTKKMSYYSSVYGPHPGPMSHLEFCKEHIFNTLDYDLCKNHDFKFLNMYAEKMENLWIP
jgi:hypothetical protein